MRCAPRLATITAPNASRRASSGAGASAQDSTGVCFGDIDNDGDEDLYVLGRVELAIRFGFV